MRIRAQAVPTHDISKGVPTHDISTNNTAEQVGNKYMRGEVDELPIMNCLVYGQLGHKVKACPVCCAHKKWK
jgi:hypothetical protein